MSDIREYIDFWVENSIHAAEQYRAPGASQDVTELVRRCVEAAEGQGISKADMEAEIGDLAGYLREKLMAANKTETDRRNHR